MGPSGLRRWEIIECILLRIVRQKTQFSICINWRGPMNGWRGQSQQWTIPQAQNQQHFEMSNDEMFWFNLKFHSGQWFMLCFQFNKIHVTRCCIFKLGIWVSSERYSICIACTMWKWISKVVRPKKKRNINFSVVKFVTIWLHWLTMPHNFCNKIPCPNISLLLKRLENGKVRDWPPTITNLFLCYWTKCRGGFP